MTHHKLLANIDRLTDQDFGVVLGPALRAIVELCNFLDKKGHCCVPVKEVIQAIEKELG